MSVQRNKPKLIMKDGLASIKKMKEDEIKMRLYNENEKEALRKIRLEDSSYFKRGDYNHQRKQEDRLPGNDHYMYPYDTNIHDEQEPYSSNIGNMNSVPADAMPGSYPTLYSKDGDFPRFDDELREKFPNQKLGSKNNGPNRNLVEGNLRKSTSDAPTSRSLARAANSILNMSSDPFGQSMSTNHGINSQPRGQMVKENRKYTLDQPDYHSEYDVLDQLENEVDKSNSSTGFNQYDNQDAHSDGGKRNQSLLNVDGDRAFGKKMLRTSSFNIASRQNDRGNRYELNHTPEDFNRSINSGSPIGDKEERRLRPEDIHMKAPNIQDHNRSPLYKIGSRPQTDDMEPLNFDNNMV